MSEGCAATPKTARDSDDNFLLKSLAGARRFQWFIWFATSDRRLTPASHRPWASTRQGGSPISSSMIRLLLPVLIAAVWGWAMWMLAMRAQRKDLDANSRPVDDPELEAVIRRLGRQVGVDHLQAHVYAMEAVNGLAAPDGRVFITTGLFDRYRRGEFTAQELGSVIAHELGHVARGHTKRRMIDWTGQHAAQMALGMILSRFLPIIGYYIAGFLARLFLTKLSRRDEFEADEYASALMTKAGFGTDPQVSMFEKLRRLTPGGRGVVWLQSHPPTEERIAAIQQRNAAWRETVAE